MGDFPSRHTTSFQRLYDVYTTSVTSYRRRIDVETTSCVYWVCTCVIRRCYCLYEQFHVIDAWEPRVFIFGKFSKSFSGTAPFTGFGLTVYQTVNSKAISYLKNTFNSNWGKESTALL